MKTHLTMQELEDLGFELQQELFHLEFQLEHCVKCGKKL